jgi:hypothetical protein
MVGVENDWLYRLPPGTLTLPTRDDLPLWITFTVQVPKAKLRKLTVKPFVFEIAGTTIEGAGVEAGLGEGDAGGDGVDVGCADGVTDATGSRT